MTVGLDGIADIQARIGAIEQQIASLRSAATGTSDSTSSSSASSGAAAFASALADATNAYNAMAPSTTTDGSASSSDSSSPGSALTAALTGNLAGNLAGALTGNLTGNLTGLAGSLLGGTSQTIDPGFLGSSSGLGTAGVDPSFLPGATSLGSLTGTSAMTGFVTDALQQAGKRYQYGAVASPSDPSPPAFDCSELVQWSAERQGIALPRTAGQQYVAAKQAGELVSVDQAMRTPGALLFSFSSEPQPGGPEPSHAHVAISLGDGRTIEARGRNYGVGIFSAQHRFTYGAIIPGLAR